MGVYSKCTVVPRSFLTLFACVLNGKTTHTDGTVSVLHGKTTCAVSVLHGKTTRTVLVEV